MRRTVRVVLVALVVGGTAIAVAAAATDERAAMVDRFQPAAPASGNVAVVAADREFTSLVEVDPLGTLQGLVDRGAAAGAAVIVIEPDLLRLAQERLAISMPNDVEVLLSVAAEQLGNVVSASVVGDLDRGDDGQPPRLARPIPRGVLATGSIATGFSTPPPASIGHPERTIAVLARPPDGSNAGSLVPALPLAALLAADTVGNSVAGEIDGDTAAVGDRRLRVEGGYRLRVNYTDALLPGGSAVLDVGDLVDDEASADRLAGAIVFVGLTDPAYAQLFPAAAGRARTLPMVFVDANAANTMATGAFLSPPDAVTGIGLGLAGAAVVALVTVGAPLWLSPVPMVLALAGLWALERARVDAGEPFDLLLASVGVAAAGLTVMAIKVTEVALARRRTASLLERYVPDSVARQLLATGWIDGASDRVEIATFFCDLRGFTPVAATLPPDDVRRLLDRFYEFVAGAVLDVGGTVMQFVGDEVFAVFGAPLPTVGAREAVAAAAAVLDGGDAFRDRLAEAGLPAIDWGIGLHVGPAVAAHVGTPRRRQYSVVGDTVNVGSRLCSQARAGEAIASEELWLAAGQPEAEPLGTVDLKGVERRVDAYRITGSAISAPAS